MTAQLPSRWKLKKIIETADQIIAEMAKSSSIDEWAFLNDDMGTPSEVKALAEFAMAAHEQEPVAKVVSKFGDPEAFGERELEVLVDIQKLPYNTLFYGHPAPVPAVPAKWPEKLTWSHHDDLTQAEVLAWNNAIDACRSALVPVPAVPDECPRSIIEDAELYDSVEDMARSMWSAMRAAMLNGGKS